MRYYSNGIEMNPAFEKALEDYIAKAREDGYTSTDEEIAAAFEVLIMDAVGIATSWLTA